jgi:hypothetical protein
MKCCVLLRPSVADNPQRLLEAARTRLQTAPDQLVVSNEISVSYRADRFAILSWVIKFVPPAFSTGPVAPSALRVIRL